MRRQKKHRVTVAFRSHVHAYARESGLSFRRLGAAAGFPLSRSHVAMYLYVNKRQPFCLRAQSRVERLLRLARIVDFPGTAEIFE